MENEFKTHRLQSHFDSEYFRDTILRYHGTKFGLIDSSRRWKHPMLPV